MATATLHATANSGCLRSYDPDYATARAGGGTVDAMVPGDGRIGQYYSAPNRYVYLFLLEFDLTAIPAGSTISAATLSLWLRFADDATAFTVEARASDFGTSVTTGDWVAGTSLSGLTLLASRLTTGMVDTDYVALDDDGLAAWLVPGALNRIVVASSRQRAGDEPTGAEYITAYYDDEGGPDEAPRLDLTYVPAVGPVPAGGPLVALRGLGALVR